MMKEIRRVVEVPAGMEVELKNTEALIKINEKQLTKKIPFSNKIKVEKKDNLIVISSKKPTRRENALAGTIEAHIKNAISGMIEAYNYKLEICNVHFPMTVRLDEDKLLIRNFLGEKLERVATILDGVEVNIKGNTIELKSSDKDAVGQTAANIESATKVKNRDRRVFQDGIYITEKEGKTI